MRCKIRQKLGYIQILACFYHKTHIIYTYLLSPFISTNVERSLPFYDKKPAPRLTFYHYIYWDATGTGQWHHSFCITPLPTPVSPSSCLYDAPLVFNSFSTVLFDSSSSFWKALLLFTPVISIIICHHLQPSDIQTSDISLCRYLWSVPLASLYILC